MKKILKSQQANRLTAYANQFPTNNWDDDFRNHNYSLDYKEIKLQMLEDQGGLCGYCEKKVSDLAEHRQRVEHFHSKSDQTTNRNWALDWLNVFIVCLGGSDVDKKIYPLPENLSCDAHKDHLITSKNIPTACEGYFINPLNILTNQNFISMDKSNGKLYANKETCRHLYGIDNCYSSLEELVEKTIEILNLNCDRLSKDRLEVLKSFNKEITKARKANDKAGFKKLAQRWFSKKWPSFFTTRRILLGKHAEEYLAQITYTG